MDDATKKMLVTVGAGAIRKVMMLQAGALVSHGIISSNNTETFVSVGMALVGAGWSFWNDFGRAIVLSQLEVLKAKSLAQAAKLQQHDIAPPTTEQIADKSPTLTADQVVKVTATLCLLLAFGLALASPAAAQLRRPLTGNPIADIKNMRTDSTDGMQSGGGGRGLSDILGALDAKLLPDLKYALALATKSGSKVTAPCYQAWITIIETRQSAAIDKDGNALPEPDPHIVTTFEKMVELRNALQPDSDFMVKCSPVASMVKRDIVGFIGVVLSGGAGLATLVPGL